MLCLIYKIASKYAAWYQTLHRSKMLYAFAKLTILLKCIFLKMQLYIQLSCLVIKFFFAAKATPAQEGTKNLEQFLTFAKKN